MVIRVATIEDHTSVEAIVAAAYALYIPRLGREPGPMLDDYASLILAGRVYVLESGGIVAGVLVLIPEQDAMLIDNIAVQPSCQGQGYGRGLLQFAERVARDAGYDAIRLYTNEVMTENIALYSKLGFVETHRAEEKGYRRIYMRKVIT
jgi:ribosomal protein S18 acetylase RimI-like enzyme